MDEFSDIKVSSKIKSETCIKRRLSGGIISAPLSKCRSDFDIRSQAKQNTSTVRNFTERSHELASVLGKSVSCYVKFIFIIYV